jgi:hypothetical protein
LPEQFNVTLSGKNSEEALARKKFEEGDKVCQERTSCSNFLEGKQDKKQAVQVSAYLYSFFTRKFG